MRAKINELILLLRTVTWLKPVQIYARIWFRLYRPKPRHVPGAQLRQSTVAWYVLPRPPRMIGPQTFTFLNRTETLSTPQHWNTEALPKLWLYNAHYFDDLVASEAGERVQWHRDLIERWIAENPPAMGNGWEPYPTSLRIVNWTKWLLSGNAPTPNMEASFATQVDWLSRRLEHHLLGNHLFANAKALVFAGCIFGGTDADRWLQTGLRLLKREIPEQILSDGGHFERSIMYHAILTEDMLDLVQLGKAFTDRIAARTVADWSTVVARMLEFLDGLTHPDGQIAFFNDGAFGIAPEPYDLRHYAEQLGITFEQKRSVIQAYPATGYTRLTQGAAKLLTDTAPIGPDYLPGHAHADTLSFEFSLDQQRVFVNGGTSVYGGNPEQRLRERSTANHNTLCIDEQNSSELWSDFRVARRAKVQVVESGEENGRLWFEGEHDGYRRLNGPIHKRRWELTQTSLTIHDTLDRQPDSAVAFFRLHPDLDASASSIDGPRKISINTTGGTLCVEDGTWSPKFGRVVPCKILVLRLHDLASSISFTWEP